MSEPTPEAPQADATEAPQEEAPTTFDADYVAKLRQEAAKYRTEAKSMKAAADELAKIKAAQQTEAERLAEARTLAEQQATEYRQKYTGLLTLQQVTDAATEAHAISPRAVYALIKDQIVVEDDGTVTGIPEAIKALQKSDPALFDTRTPGTLDANAGRGIPPTPLNGDGLERALRKKLGIA